MKFGPSIRGPDDVEPSGPALFPEINAAFSFHSGRFAAAAAVSSPRPTTGRRSKL